MVMQRYAGYYPPLLKEATTPTGAPATVLLVDPGTDVGKYITAEITGAGKNPNDPQALTEFITAHDSKAKASTGFALVAVAVALLVWWGQKKGNLPASLGFIKNKFVFWGVIAAAAFFIYRAYDMNNKNKQVQQALASFIQFVQAAAQQQPAPPPPTT